jgi:hypothetical protein
LNRRRDRSVTQHLLNDLGVHVLREQQRRGRVPQGVEAPTLAA